MSDTPEIVYADDYEAITGKPRPVQTKVVGTEPKHALEPDVVAETKTPDQAEGTPNA